MSGFTLTKGQRARHLHPPQNDEGFAAIRHALSRRARLVEQGKAASVVHQNGRPFSADRKSLDGISASSVGKLGFACGRISFNS